MGLTFDILESLFHRQYRLITLVLLVAIAASGGLGLAQDAAERGLEPAVPVLEYSTYDCKWLRYLNHDADGEAKLALDTISLFPFRYLIARSPVELIELEAAATLAEQLAQYKGDNENALATGDGRFDGVCDTEKLGEKSTDVLCVPGVDAMPLNRVGLALFNPETFEIAALTTAIYNKAGDAVRTACEIPAIDAPSETAREDRHRDCCLYAPGQGISATEYAASGLNLPLDVDNGQVPVLSYVFLAIDSASSYLRAQPLIESTTAPAPLDAQSLLQRTERRESEPVRESATSAPPEIDC
ncbi:MAG: hypothetical protein OXG85_11685 [Chloroflexi bacterium]|nr:hypothetical protein [Chloroflexota bacterium]